MGLVTFYSYYLMSMVLDHCEREGRRHIRFRELAADVLGNKKIFASVVIKKPGVFFFFPVSNFGSLGSFRDLGMFS